MINLVTMSSQQETMSSREIAELTGKRHDNVLRDIREQLFTGLYGCNFNDSRISYPLIQGLTVVTDDHTKRTAEILLDREHTLTLITGYDVKSRHTINKRWLELETKQRPMSVMEMIIASATQLIALEQEQERQARELKELKAQVSGSYGFCTVQGYANVTGLKLTSTQGAKFGKAASALSRKLGIQIGSVPDAKYGKVNTYHEDVLKEILG